MKTNRTSSLPRHGFVAAAALAAGVLIAACHEIPQDARKPFTSDEDVKPYAGAMFHGDKAGFEKALEKRSHASDDYALIPRKEAAR